MKTKNKILGCKWKRQKKMFYKYFQILLIVAIILSIWIVTEPWFTKPRIVTTKPPDKNRVRFEPEVRITSAGGKKKDRYNPDLRTTVSKNAQLAASVGGAKRLAEISLMEADDSR